MEKLKDLVDSLTQLGTVAEKLVPLVLSVSVLVALVAIIELHK